MLHAIFTVNDVINDTLGWIYCAHSILFDLRQKHDFVAKLRSLCIELKYVFVVTQVIDSIDRIADPSHSIFNKVFYLAINVWFTWYALRTLKDSDDDRWKRRRKKAAETVKAIGGKLVVVPVLEPAPIGAR